MARTRSTSGDELTAPDAGTKRLGAHLAAFSPGWNALLSTPNAAAAIAEAGRLGYSSVALPITYPTRYPIAEMRNALARAAIAPVCLVALPPNAHLPARPEHARNWLGRALDVTEAMGGRLLAGALGWTPGIARGTPDTLDGIAAAQALLVEVLRDLAQDARRRGITLALEPANRYETTLCNTLAAGVALVEAIDLPNMGLLANTHHMHMEEANPAQALADAGNHLFAIRLAENNRALLGQGAVAWQQIWATLAASHFSGLLIADAPYARDGDSGDQRAQAAAEIPALAALRFMRAGLASATQPAKAKPARKKVPAKSPPAPETPAAKSPPARKRSNTKSYRGRT